MSFAPRFVHAELDRAGPVHELLKGRCLHARSDLVSCLRGATIATPTRITISGLVMGPPEALVDRL